MTIATNADREPENQSGSSFIPLPRTTNEVTTVLAHYYRGEIARATGWRDRIDRTTNWAITLIGAMLSVSLSASAEHHGILLFAMLLLLMFLFIEARRYRFFDVYRVRLRQLERHYFAQVFAPVQEASADWAYLMAEDLRRPVFLITFQEAVARRLRRNYFWLFLILLLAWVIKIGTVKPQAGFDDMQLTPSFKAFITNAALGPFSGRTVIIFVAVFYGVLLIQTLRSARWSSERDDGHVHV